MTALVGSVALLAAACGSTTSDSETSADADPTTTAAVGTTEASVEDTTGTEVDGDGSDATTTTASAAETTSTEVADGETDTEPAAATASCAETAATFTTRGSANPDLEDPFVEATCDGDTITILTNAVPDYTYIETSPGQPGGRESTYTVPATPVMAEATTDVPYIGAAGITLGGIPIFGPTEGTGGDVDSLPGIISACGSHNGPSGFHIHKITTSSETDCLFTPEEVAEDHQLVGYAFDGFPIYTGIDQFTSSWQLTDESLFASDTWAAHTYVEGSGDLDECNGRVDENGDYAYYTTETFPYVLGCFVGEVELTGPGADAEGGERPERPEGDAGAGAEGEPPARPEDEEGAAARPERPERPEGDDAGERPERPEPPEGEGAAGERPDPPADGGEE